MTIYLSPLSGAIEQMTTLLAELEVLRTLLEGSVNSVRVDTQYRIPFRSTAEVNQSLPVEVRILSGVEAVETAIDGLTIFRMMTGQNAKETFRAPGAVGVPKLVLDQIIKTNAMRIELFQMLTKMPVTERKIAWKKQHNIVAVVPSQVLRVTTVLSDPQTVVHYWDTGKAGNRYQAQDLIHTWEDTLKEHHGFIPSMEDSLEGTMERKLLYGIDMLRRLRGDEQVAVKRDVAPHIRARGRDGDKRYLKITSSPLVYDVTCPRPSIKELKSYIPTTEKQTSLSRAKLLEDPYIEAMNVYRYEDEYREFGPVTKRKNSRHERPSADK